MFLTNLMLQEVQSGAFANMTRLVRLILTKNKIHRLEEGSLTGASIFVSQVRLYLSHRCVYICLTGASIFVTQVRLYLSHRCVYICLTGASILVSQVRLYLSHMQQYLLRKGNISRVCSRKTSNYQTNIYWIVSIRKYMINLIQ
jgi:hypothetical protein